MRKEVGQLYFQRAKYPLAVAQLQTALDAQPNDAETLQLLIDCHDRMKNPEGAIAQVLRALEKGQLVVRWGRDPKQGVYAYPKGFPGYAEEHRWAIYKGQWAPFQTVEEAKKAFDE